MDRIQTAGQQRYYDFISERAKRVRTTMIVWASLLCLALISLFNNIVIALILAVAGIVLAVFNVKSQKELKGKLETVPEREEFFRQLASADVLTAQDGRVLAAKDYVLTYKKDISIYFIPDMIKVEENLQENGKKSLFLTDSQGNSHEILSCVKATEDSAQFEKIYQALKERMGFS